MKKRLFILLILMTSFFITFTQGNKVVVERMNTVIYGNIYSSNFIKFDSYVTREVINDPYYQFKYEIVLINTSRANNSNVTIYITGINVFGNNFNISGQQYPAGFWALVPSNTPSVIYWYKTNDPNMRFTYTWSNIQFY